MGKDIHPEIELKFIVNGKRFGGVIKVPDDWSLSEYKTYEQVYIAGHLTQPERTGYSYSLWLERPLARERR